MRKSLLFIFAGLLIVFASCRKDFEFEPSNGGLEFSRDTVYLDTVFTDIGSSTYTLKVYNRSDRDIEIPSVKLGKGIDSKYRMTVDGMTGDVGAQGKIFSNVELLANDSLFIFIETTANIADANPADFLYTDQIQFDGGSNLQTVELVTLIQDAVFLYPQRFEDGTTETLTIGEDEIYGFYLDENDPIHGNEYLFTNDKPYVIYGYAAVETGKTLNIEPGARIHCHDGSGIIVSSGASIQAIGALSADPELMENEIIFESDRLEPLYSDIPGQWGTIWLTSGSAPSNFNHVTIKNAVIGLYIQNNTGTINIKNTQIYDCSNFGIWAQTGNIEGENIVINTAGQATLACTLGGSYLFKHCTFNNNWASSKQVAVLVDNFYEDETGEHGFDLNKAEFDNCIIYGSNQVEFLLNKTSLSGYAFNYNLNSCLLKFNNTNNQFTNHPEYQFNDPAHYTNIIRNDNPEFFNVNRNKLNIDSESGAYQKGDVAYIIQPDIIGATRLIPPDLGAYQSAPFPEED